MILMPSSSRRSLLQLTGRAHFWHRTAFWLLPVQSAHLYSCCAAPRYLREFCGLGDW